MNLHLTSPYMRGPEVEKAQRALNHSRLGDFYDGPIDGIYGEHTANATRNAWSRIGFPQGAISRHFNDRLMAYLQGDKKPTNAMDKRAKARKAQDKPSGRVFPTAVEIGRKRLGVNEDPPGSNRVLFSEWYGVIGSWCAMFVSWCMVQAGSDVFQQHVRFAYVPNILAAAHQGVGNMRVVNETHARHCKTDLALWNFPGSDHHPNHVSFVLEINGGTCKSLDGNTSVSSQNDGGEVMIRERSTSLVEAYVHITE